MKRETKLQKLIDYLKENNIEYIESINTKARSDVFLPSVGITLKIEGVDYDEFKKKYRGRCGWILVNDDKTLKDLKAEVAETVIKIMQNKAKKIENRKYAAECWKRHEEKLMRKAKLAKKVN